ncbi:MAG: helix-turn-helix transcriptional regulator [Hyphomicrobiaceae bacterium]|nr:helix-turn-helix transcriptional regulator [Hyphomicrobiaceae bacterium]
MDKAEERLKFQLEINRRRQTSGGGIDSGPPYHVSGIDMMYFMGRFDPLLIRRILPPELEPAGTEWGTIAIYNVQRGWGMAPFTAFIMGFEIAGDAPVDGQPRQYLHSGLCSGRGGDILRSRYNGNYLPGWSRQYSVDGRLIGEVGQDEQILMRMSGNIAAGAFNHYSGTNHYVGRMADGALHQFSVTFTGEFADLTEQKVEFFAGAEAVLRVARPIEFYWTAALRNAAFTFSVPRVLGATGLPDEDNDGAMLLVDMFSHMGRAAIVVDREGHIRRVNNRAELLVREYPEGSDWVATGNLGPALREIVRTLDGSDGNQVSPATVIPSVKLGRSIVAQAMALDKGVFGEGNAVVFLDDPSAAPETMPVAPALRLMGLTEAEAKIAALVGAGRSPAEAAGDLELSVNTVRSALKLIFDKLGIGRQAELAKIVTRLESRAIA